MFVGHFGIALGAKKIAPKVSLGTLFMATIFLDLLWPVFLLLGWERVKINDGETAMTPLNFEHYPISHSLLMAVIWGLALGVVYFLFKKDKRGALVSGLVVVSHWLLDLLVHQPDLPLLPTYPLRLGFGLWNFQAIELLIEGGIFFMGILIYLRSTTSKSKTGTIAFWSLIIFLMLIFAGNIFGPAPTDVQTLAWTAMSQWVLVLWGYWIDWKRKPQTTPIAWSNMRWLRLW